MPEAELLEVPRRSPERCILGSWYRDGFIMTSNRAIEEGAN